MGSGIAAKQCLTFEGGNLSNSCDFRHLGRGRIKISLDIFFQDLYNAQRCTWGCGAEGARFLGMEEVGGSNPPSSTIENTGVSAKCRNPFFVPRRHLDATGKYSAIKNTKHVTIHKHGSVNHPHHDAHTKSSKNKRIFHSISHISP